MRRQHDFYPTHSRLTEILVEQQWLQIGGIVLEPCAGKGDMANVLRQHDTISSVLTNDVNPQVETTFQEDATDPNAACWQASFDWVITNPPFEYASAILQQAWKHARVGVAFLLRLTYLEPTRDRAVWLQEQADHLVWQAVFNPRPTFREGETNPKTEKPYGTDSVTVAWFVWRKSFSWQRSGIMCPFGFMTGWKKD